MTYADGFILSMIGLSVMIAWLRGLGREVGTLVAIGAGALAVHFFGGSVAGLLGDGPIKAMAMLGILFFVTFTIVAIGVETAASSFIGPKPGMIDKLSGAAFGLLRGWLIVGLAYLASTYYFPEDDLPAPMENAVLKPIAMSAAKVLESFGLQREYDSAESSDDTQSE